MMMAGVTRQALGVHSGDDVAFYQKLIDRSDCNLPHEFRCDRVVHFTENEYAESIGSFETDEPFRFKARQCRIASTQSFNLTWWSALPPIGWEEVVGRNLCLDAMDFHDCGAFGESAAFDGPSLCGPFGFVTTWAGMLKQYAVSRQSNVNKIEFRVLGTFRYRKEIMYAVLVCIQSDMGVETFPLLPYGTGTEAFVPMTGDFIWKVYSTIGFSEDRPSNVDWTWDHLSFGFNFPTSELSLPPQLCGIMEKEANPYKPLSRGDQYRRRTQEETIARPYLMNRLNGKISRAIRIDIANRSRLRKRKNDCESGLSFNIFKFFKKEKNL